MKAQSDVYIKLQNIYKSKARQDASEILAIVRSVADGEDIDPAEVDLFCVNARFIKLVNTPRDELALDRIVGKQAPSAHSNAWLSASPLLSTRCRC